jgi:hypothetical protein
VTCEDRGVPHDLLLAAVRENASWCDVVTSAHGLTGSWSSTVWSCPTRTPPLFPDAVTLSPTAEMADVVDRIDASVPGATVKDSFAALEAGDSWTVLFDGTWLHHPPSGAGADIEPWEAIEPERVDAWLAAWGGPSQVLEPLLRDPTVTMIAGPGATITSGAVLHDDGWVVGVSNLFAPAGADPAATWTGCLEAAARRWPDRPIVGYEAGDDLAGALAHGSVPLGPMRVWVLTA